MTAAPHATIPGTAFPQLSLRPVTAANADAVASWIDSDIARPWLDLGSGRQRMSKRDLFLMLTSNRVDARIPYEPGQDVPMGLVVLNDIHNEMGSAEVWGVRGHYAGGPVGVAVASFLLALANGFLEHDRQVIGSWVVAGNQLSVAMHLQLGMVETGRQRNRHLLNGRHRDRLLFDITRDDFATRFPDVASDSGATFRQRQALQEAADA